jgi:uncharacterized membrane protein YbaN (DUF454 family)
MTKTQTTPRSAATRLQRWLFAALGVLCVGLGGIGVVVPGLPTTVFVLMASYFFTKSCPWLEERMLRNRLFARSMEYVDGERSLDGPKRWMIMGIIALCTASSALIVRFGGGPVAVQIGIALFGLVGVVFVALWRRQPAPLEANEGEGGIVRP